MSLKTLDPSLTTCSILSLTFHPNNLCGNVAEATHIQPKYISGLPNLPISGFSLSRNLIQLTLMSQ